jgi:hypothetical protein
MAELEQEHMARENNLLAQVSDLQSHVLSYEERIDGLLSANIELSRAQNDSVWRLLDAALRHQSTLTAQIDALQAELRAARATAVAEVSAVAECEVHIALLMKQLEKVAAIARVKAEGLIYSTIRVFHGLAISTRQSLETLGLDHPQFWPPTRQGSACGYLTSWGGSTASLMC